MAQVSRYRAATISSVLLSEFAQRQQVAQEQWEHRLAPFKKHLSRARGEW